MDVSTSSDEPKQRHWFKSSGQRAGPECEILTGIGPLKVRRPMVRDRATEMPPEAGIRFTSNILRSEASNARRSMSLDALLLALDLRGVSTCGFHEALAALLGTDAPNLPPGAIARLSAGWQEEYGRWQGRDLTARRYV